MSPYALGPLLSEVLALLALSIVNTPALQLSNGALLTVLNSQTRQQELTGPFHIYGEHSVRFDNRSIQCEHKNREL